MNSEKKIITLIIIVILIIITLVFTVIKPGVSEIKNLSERIENEQKLLEDLYLRGQTLSKVKNEYKEIEKDLPLLENVFLLDGKELEFITSLEKIAREQKISQEVNLGEKQNLKDEYKLMPIQLSLKGDFLNLIRYFREIEKFDFYFNIDSLTITALPGSEKQVSVSLSANTYWQK